MAMLDAGLLVLTLLNAVVGGWSIHWARAEPQSWRCRGGCILFVVNLLALGITGIIAAVARAQGLPPLGLVGGLLIVGMMWERPGDERQHQEAIAGQPVAER